MTLFLFFTDTFDIQNILFYFLLKNFNLYFCLLDHSFSILLFKTKKNSLSVTTNDTIMKIKNGSAWGLFLCICCCFSCQQEKTFRVLQFNIRQEGAVVEKGFEAVADEIARSKADFVTLSEVRNYHHTRFCDRIVEAL